MLEVVVGNEKFQVKYLKIASKGDLIFGLSDKWLIAVNLPWSFNEHFFGQCTVHVEKIKEVSERRFALVKVTKIERTYERTREEVEHREPQVHEFHGIRVKTGTSVVAKIREEVKDVWTPESNSNSFQETEIRVLERHEYTDQRTTFEIIENNKITRLLQLSNGFYLFDIVNGFIFNVYYNYTSAEFRAFQGISEQELLELSKYYVIAYPFITCKFPSGVYYLIHIYHNSRKFEVSMNTFERDVPHPLNFRATLRRFALTRHYKSLLPFGDVFEDPIKLTDFLRGAYSKVKEVEAKTDLANSVKDNLDFMERFLEIFFIRTPKRKLKAIEPYLVLHERLRKMLRDEPVLYISFPKKYGAMHSNYAGFRIQGDSISVHGIVPFPVTTIAIKGKFEEAYKDVHNLRKLLRYQFAEKEEKLKMLREDIEALRAEIEEKFGKKVSELHPELDIMRYLLNRAEQYEGDNLALLLYKARNLARAPDIATILKIAGLIKSGKDYDYTEERLKDVLESLRIAVKYEIKRKGYSTRLGVIFSGTPQRIARSILETVKKMQESRMTALLTEILLEDVQKLEEMVTVSERIEALKHELVQ